MPSLARWALFATCWCALASGAAWSGTPVPLSLTWEQWAAGVVGTDAKLLTVVCERETEAERVDGRQDLALGDGGRSIGRCQVKIATAAHLMGLRAKQLTPEVRASIRKMLHDPGLGSYFAARELAWCLRHKRTTERAVFCYQAGRAKKWRGPTDGTRMVMAAYKK